MELPKLVTGPWTLKDLKEGKIGSPKHGLKVFSCFHCGGGSTMGYKLAGFDVLGGVEIDPEMMQIYKTNHNPKYSYLMGVQDFKNIPNSELPDELFDLDILDGSPPCSSFSMAGAREKAWGEKKKFREGQAEQVLDDLFFHFIDVARKLKPKIVVAENVKGLIQGNARGYVKEIFRSYKDAGYEVQLFLLNASLMGVPQARERTFFIARRNDLSLPKLILNFEESRITVAQAIQSVAIPTEKQKIAPSFEQYWKKALPGQTIGQAAGVEGKWFGYIKSNPNKPANTLASARGDKVYHWKEWRALYSSEWTRLQSFPEDFDFLTQKEKDRKYIIGMSVPPFMMQRVASKIAEKLL